MPAGNPFSDADLLRILDLSEQGLTYRQIAARMGRPHDSIRGTAQRIRSATEPSVHDGTMPPNWWQAGLRARA